MISPNPMFQNTEGRRERQCNQGGTTTNRRLRCCAIHQLVAHEKQKAVSSKKVLNAGTSSGQQR